MTDFSAFEKVLHLIVDSEPSATFTDQQNLMRNFSTFSLACLFILLSVRKVS